MKKYKFLLLDADGTLLDFRRSEAEAITNTLAAHGIKPTKELVDEYSVINLSLWKLLEKKQITKSELKVARFRMLCERHAFDADPGKMAETYLFELSGKSYLLDGAKELCESLCASYPLYIITNGIEAVQKGRFSSSPLLPYLSGIFISGELGAEKPDREFFERASARIPGFTRESALVIGDTLSSDILGGINAGIDTMWYNPGHEKIPDDMPVYREIKYEAASYDEIKKLLLY